VAVHVGPGAPEERLQLLVDGCLGHGLQREWRRLQLLVDGCLGHGLQREWRRLQQLVAADLEGHVRVPEWQQQQQLVDCRDELYELQQRQPVAVHSC
jgi:NAD(P)H-hydrate repair Nnr-like enzyme with NAD(P)H-hydrate epimerase domain